MNRQRYMRRKFLAPEVVQTSPMDCGPAALKCVLDGFGVPVSYGRLREACQTNLDGTSIDTLEELANQLGLEAGQTILPTDLILRPELDLLPAVAVVRGAHSAPHFVVVWRQFAGLVQVMDPSRGRRWLSRERFLDELFVHGLQVPAAAWRDWVGSARVQAAFAARLADMGVSGRALLERAAHHPDWRPLATLDAALRMVSSLVHAKAVHKGAEAARVLGALVAQSEREPAAEEGAVPWLHWAVRPLSGAEAASEGATLLLRGAVIVQVRRREGTRARPRETGAQREAGAKAPARPLGRLLALLREDGLWTPAALSCAVVMAALGAALEALLLRGVFELGRRLGPPEQRLSAVGAVLALGVALTLLEVPILSLAQRAGRQIEFKLRALFCEKLPRLSDRYFQSRPLSDLAERSHSLFALRRWPMLAVQLLRTCAELVVTVAGVIWLDPAGTPLALALGALSIALPFAAQAALNERDLKARTHDGALTQFYLDALLGLFAVRSQGAERAMRREHEAKLSEWTRAGASLLRAALAGEALSALGGLGIAAWLFVDYVQRAGDPRGLLLLLYWVLNLPALGRQAATLARQYPEQRNIAARLFEPLDEPDDPSFCAASGARPPDGGVRIEFRDVDVKVAGHALLAGISLTVEAGSHVAIVGASGAGKSSLVGLLLGWQRPASGQIILDGQTLAGPALATLRRQTVWVDPAVQLWNRSLLENLHYGAPDAAPERLAGVLSGADLTAVLERLPDGLQSSLGEGGALVSGGEGQRVRFGRALTRADARLVILDEPFRGLARDQRRTLLARARAHWQHATLLCVTHDVGETRDFARVLVVDRGAIVEDGSPQELAARPGSRYRALLTAEARTQRAFSAGADWRRVEIVDGALGSER